MSSVYTECFPYLISFYKTFAVFPRLTSAYKTYPVLTSVNQYYPIFSQPIPPQGGLRQRVGIMFVTGFVSLSVGMSTVISLSSSSPSSLEEGSSQTCVGAVPRDLSLYDIMSGIR